MPKRLCVGLLYQGELVEVQATPLCISTFMFNLSILFYLKKGVSRWKKFYLSFYAMLPPILGRVYKEKICKKIWMVFSGSSRWNKSLWRPPIQRNEERRPFYLEIIILTKHYIWVIGLHTCSWPPPPPKQLKFWFIILLFLMDTVEILISILSQKSKVVLSVGSGQTVWVYHLLGNLGQLKKWTKRT